MRISLDETQLETLAVVLNKIIQSFDKFSENIKKLIISIEKLSVEIKNAKNQGT